MRKFVSDCWRRFKASLLCSIALFCCIAAFSVVLQAGENKLVVHPSKLELSGSVAKHGFLVTRVSASGAVEDVTAKAAVTVPENSPVQLASSGQLAALKNGKATISISHEGLSTKLPVTIEQTSDEPAPSFRQDIVPLLTRFGCNAGSCHGKGAGQNSFKLSLRGYAPEWDYDWLIKEVAGRRINFADPDASLLVQKATGAVPHEGGRRIVENSRGHQLLRDWIMHRAPGPNATEEDAESLEILPGNRDAKVGETQQLLVRAHYRGGVAKDVTWLSKFFSNDESIVSVTEDGLVKNLRVGEASVRIHFQGLVSVVMFTIPHDQPIDAGLFAGKNNKVDDHVFGKLNALGIPPSGPSSDQVFIRRAYLDTVGSLPPPEAVHAFLASNHPQKRSKLADQLLESPEYVDYWTLQLADLLQNRKERDHDVRGAKGVRAFHSWLRQRVAENRGWHEITREVLLAKGDVIKNPEAGYFVTTIGEQQAPMSEAPDSVAQSFLGTRIGCAKCHNHPLEKYTQDDYFHFAAFFSRVSLKRESPNKSATVLNPWSRDEQRKREEIERNLQDLAKTDQPPEKKKEREDRQKKLAEELGRLQQEGRAGVRQPRTQKFLEPQPLDRTKFTFQPGEDPREELVDWITDPKNEAFSGSMINRLWKHFLGVGMVEPVDDLRASNPPSNPALWKFLSDEFVTSNYNLKQVMRLILNSRAYQLSGETNPQNETDRKFYSHYMARRLPSEALADAISNATGVPDEFAGYPVGFKAVQLPDPAVGSYFLGLFGRSERVTACACERNGDVSLSQLLHLHNGEEISKKIRSNEGNLAKLLQAEKDNEKLIDQIFTLALSRPANPNEKETIRASLGDGSEREEVFRDLFWALLNTKEFAFNH